MGRISLNLPLREQAIRQKRIVQGVATSRVKSAVRNVITGQTDYYSLYDPSTYLNGESKTYSFLPDTSSIKQLLGITQKEKPRYKTQFGVGVEDYFALRKKKGEEFVDLTALVNVTRKKTIILTNIEGRDRSRKEYVNAGDFMVTVNGLVSSGIPGIYPEDRVKLLIDMLNHKGVLSVDCPHLNRLGINGLVVLDYKLPQETGQSNTQKYTINCVFEKPVEFIKFEEQEQKKTLQAALAKVNEWVALDLAVDSIFDKII